MSEVTRILEAIQQGNSKASEELFPLVYDELRKVAAQMMLRERPGQTLQPTALVHEAWLRLVGPDPQFWNSRSHFFAAAAEAMRRILIANARRKRREKHGGALERVPIDQVEVAADADPDTLLLVNEALDRLAERDPVKAELVKLRFMVGMSNEEAAAVLNLSVPTVKRYWTFARAWMFEEITRLQRTS
ncbi:MAG: sigma-70 family RNA polymerase sigma factor [Verrucomicrobiales bacterium]|nr:sigma-70 family RNA polymerase sigma factor [Verrucomicrobiales bacterium]